MQTYYKERILKEIEKVPSDKLPNLYRIIHLLTKKIVADTKKASQRVSLRGIWKVSYIDNSLFDKARESLSPYEKVRT